jgi:hypothetical protein
MSGTGGQEQEDRSRRQWQEAWIKNQKQETRSRRPGAGGQEQEDTSRNRKQETRSRRPGAGGQEQEPEAGGQEQEAKNGRTWIGIFRAGGQKQVSLFCDAHFQALWRHPEGRAAHCHYLYGPQHMVSTCVSTHTFTQHTIKNMLYFYPCAVYFIYYIFLLTKYIIITTVQISLQGTEMER